MRYVSLVLALVNCTVVLHGQAVVHSVMDGAWTDVATWDCACVPANADTVIVDHQVQVLTDQLKTAGALRVEAAGSLLGAPGVGFTCLAKVVNEGAMSFDDLRLKATMPDSTFNHGSITCADDLVLEGLFANYGTVISLDTMRAYAFKNMVGADLQADFMNLTLIWNLGTGTCVSAYLLSIGNYGSFIVQDRVEMLRVSGAGLIVMGDAEVDDFYALTGPVHIHGDATFYLGTLEGPHMFIDGDVVITGWVDWDTPAALMSIGGDLLNLGNMTGGPVEGATLCVGGQIINQNYITGPLDICDLSPTAVTTPFIDMNVGVIEPDVTFCATGRCAVRVGEQDALANVIIGPNPTNDWLTITGLPSDLQCWSLHDAMGRLVKRSSQRTTERMEIDLQDHGTGVYLLRIYAGDGCRAFRVIKE